MAKKMIAGNWKMYKNNSEALRLIKQLRNRLEKNPARKSKIVICPPFTALSLAAKELASSRIELGAQNIFWEEEGAYTGEISADMVKSTGAKWTIIGHSERRQYFKEDEKVINRKIKLALKKKLKVIFCIGETLELRQQNLTKDIVTNQVEWGLKDLDPAQLKNIVTAYEPVWAIGTGKTATPDQAQEIHSFLREIIDALFGAGTGQKMTILYGGSVKPDNAEGLFSRPDIDGALVGGACLDASSFMKIIKAGEGVF
ncbi:MAG: triose-phosphate isomerase [Calditrichaeota bacterium]|nr:triose-phosphate isomerase [Calditrichota bacterium]RQV98162.1 MAG: triose-phosphate isomerase [Calditrichota bacterium]